MTKSGFAQNGETPVTRRECAERHEHSLVEAKKALDAATDAATRASRDATFWIKISLIVMGLVDALILAMIVLSNSAMASAATRSAAAEKTSSMNEVRIEAASQARLEAQVILMRRLDTLETKIDDLNKVIRSTRQP